MAYLLDTNVVSETRMSRPNSGVVRWIESTPSSAMYLSVLVIGELRQGVERLRRRDAERAGSLDQWLSTIERDYADRIVPVDGEVANRWGVLNVPDPLPVVDGLQAATALVHGWTFVTRNTKDVRSTGVAMLDPFDEPAS